MSSFSFSSFSFSSYYQLLECSSTRLGCVKNFGPECKTRVSGWKIFCHGRRTGQYCPVWYFCTLSLMEEGKEKSLTSLIDLLSYQDNQLSLFVPKSLFDQNDYPCGLMTLKGCKNLLSEASKIEIARCEFWTSNVKIYMLCVHQQELAHAR